MPFGMISAQNELKRITEEAFEGLDGFAVIIDDLLFFGSIFEEHNKQLTAILERAREKGIRFNKGKYQFSLTYFGHAISEQGIQPDLDKLEAINNMPMLSNQEEHTTLLGIVKITLQYTVQTYKHRKKSYTTSANPQNSHEPRNTMKP